MRKTHLCFHSFFMGHLLYPWVGYLKTYYWSSVNEVGPPPVITGGVHPDLIFAYKGKDSLIRNEMMVHDMFKKSINSRFLFDQNYAYLTVIYNLIIKGDALSLRAYLLLAQTRFYELQLCPPTKYVGFEWLQTTSLVSSLTCHFAFSFDWLSFSSLRVASVISSHFFFFGVEKNPAPTKFNISAEVSKNV